jgi:ATP-dependent helicase/DNAse subunit B
MPLRLVTGPANAAKAGEVLGGLRDRLDEEPILVVPAFTDVEHAQRELAQRGAIFGAEVLRFDRLFREIARRGGYGARVASELQRELIVEAAIERARLELLAESAARPGFVRAAARFVAELNGAVHGLGPPRFTSALRAWAGDGPRRRYADELAALYRCYRDGLERAELVDRELFRWNALDALSRTPERWRSTPLFVYGFDDFTVQELAALETVSKAGADVLVSLPFEPGREAFKATAGIQAELIALGASVTALDPLSDHYAPESRQQLHRLERELYELSRQIEVPAGGHGAMANGGPASAGAGAPADRAAAIDLGGERDTRGAAVVEHSAGGERAEVELAAAELLRLLRDGTPAGDVAVVFRDPERYASLLEQVFGAYGIPYSIDRSLAFGHTSLGRGLLALVRCALLDGSAEDLLAWLRTPGKLDQPILADRLEATVRREGATTAQAARELWEDARWPLDELDRLREARTAPALVAELHRQVQRLFAAPYRRQAPVLAGSQLDDARAFRAAHDGLRQLYALVDNAGMALDATRLHEMLERLTVHVGENPQPDRVQVAPPEAIRARRFEAVFVCGLQESEFPRGSVPEPFLPDDDRRALATASGLRLPLREDQLDRERYLFYVCASRAERLLVLSSRTSDEEGNPQSPSYFLEDVRDALGPLPLRRRSLSDVTWDPEEAPTTAEWYRALALRGPRAEGREPAPLSDPAVLERLAERETVSAAALERFADCPVKWLVDDLLRPLALEPDPEQMVRGSYAHTVLERTYRRLREETGERRLTPASLPAAERILLEELRANQGEFRLSPKQTRVRAAMRRLEFDLLRYLRHDAATDGAFEPEHLELAFGGPDEAPVEVAEGLAVRGTIDRVDVWDGHALVRDYKSGKRVDSYKVASWESENRLQAALYMLVVERLLGLRPAGGVYVPLGGTDRRPRGMVRSGMPELGSDFFENDRRDEDEFEAVLERARERIVETAERLRGGRICSSPESCAWNGGCSYPSICRSED